MAVIGEVVEGTPGQVIITDERGRSIEMVEDGWDHLNG